MSVIATAVKHLIAAGVTGDALVAAIADMEAQMRTEPKQRSAGAIRTERYRAKKAAEASQSVTCDESDACDVTPSLSPAPSSFPQTPNQHPHPHTHPDTNTRARKADRFPESFPCPDWAEPEVWADLIRNRKTKNLTNTATAHRNFVRAVEGMADAEWPPGRLLEAIVALGWGGAHDPRENRTNGTHRPQALRSSDRGSTDRRSTLARVIDQGLDFLG